ncbi:MAG: orotate phosphoribosyltransferase [Bacteroidota bacterium]|nr:orotate phosphoribosyltransferase [Bacteroidota bacterium]MDP4226872.1 orotate phosphoribosyltransferase [Bacteroidota bacterium]
MINREKIIAQYLLQSKAIKLEPANPFTWASGMHAPIYCDNRKTLSLPEIRSVIRDEFTKMISENFVQAEMIAGVATGAIAQGALVADKMNLPFVYVRSEPKKHGLENLIEGIVVPGKKVVVVEDLISTGGSSLKAVESLRKAGCRVLGLVAIFSYGFDKAIENFKNANCPFYTLTNYNTLVNCALEINYINQNELLVLKKWREDPQNWKP